VLAAGDINETACPNEGLAGYSANLPDCRAYEQVSPTDKEGGSGGVLPGALSLPDGSAITYPGEPFAHALPKTFHENPTFETYTSVRSSSGWSTVNGDTLRPEEAPVPLLPSYVPPSGAQVLEETPNGSRVFFLDEQHAPGITTDSTAAVGEPDLYEYDVPNGQLTDLTVDQSGHADVRGILGVGGEGSEEGSYVYYVADSVLTSIPNTKGEKATPGDCHLLEESVLGCNLYLTHHGETTFIAKLSPADDNLEDAQEPATIDWRSPAERSAEVSPNGRYVTFGSHEELTGQPVEPVKGPNERPTPEIFRYDAEARSLACVSCSPLNTPVPGAKNPQSSQTAINGAHRQQYMLNDGRVLFTTTAKLVPQDTNRQADVYEWETNTPHLISGGTSETSTSVFADASTTGSDIFFTTSQSLVPQDQDEITDLYDAREGGGFPQPPAAACAITTACLSPPATPPALIGASGSATFTGTEPPPLPTAIVPPPPPGPKPLTRAQKLTKALRACHAKRNKKNRAACETTARKQYGPKHQKHRS
jgi:hypothetical protein